MISHAELQILPNDQHTIKNKRLTKTGTRSDTQDKGGEGIIEVRTTQDN